jgi:putative two-component system hydrogenase maturation factor HypX/HoxX
MAPGREYFQSVDQVLVRMPTAVVPDTKLCFLLVCDAFNSMAQRASLKLKESGHEVVVHVFKDGESMVGAVGEVNPDVILCPFLTKRIPVEVYKGPVPCLVIHPGIEGDRGMSSIDWALQESQPEWGVTILQAEEEMDAGPIWATR